MARPKPGDAPKIGSTVLTVILVEFGYQPEQRTCQPKKQAIKPCFLVKILVKIKNRQSKRWPLSRKTGQTKSRATQTRLTASLFR